MSFPRSRAMEEKRLLVPFCILRRESDDDRDADREVGGDGRGSLRFKVSERFWPCMGLSEEYGDGDRGGDRAVNGDVGLGDSR